MLAGHGRRQPRPSGLRVVEAKGPAFPVRTYVLSLPAQSSADDPRRQRDRERQLGPRSDARSGEPGVEGDVRRRARARHELQHDGQAARGRDRGRAGVRAQRNPNEQLGVIDFNRHIDDRASADDLGREDLINARFETPPVTTGTHIFDAVAQAEAMLNAANISSGSIVVALRRSRHGSTKTLAQVAKAARAARTCGSTRSDWPTRRTSPARSRPSRRLGTASTRRRRRRRLAPLFDQLSRQLSNEYLLQYTSLAGPSAPRPRGGGSQGLGHRSASYRTPPLPVTSATGDALQAVDRKPHLGLRRSR